MKKVSVNTRILCDGMQGKNYWFNGCMEYLMECLGEDIKDYSYWFFSGVTGDTFTQIYSKNLSNMALCYTHNVLEQAINKAFDACGYNFTYISSVKENDYKQYDKKIKEYIDKNIPVIAKIKDKDNNTAYTVIYGYDNENFYYLTGGDAEAKTYPNKYDELIFVGDKKDRPTLAEIYRKMILDIPAYLIKPSTEKYSFGKQAFIDWAESSQNGTFDNIPVDDKVWYTHGDSSFTCWNMHGTYICMLGTNACIDDCLEKALALNPEMTFISELLPLYKRLSVDGFEALIGMQGGFSLKPETIKNKELMKPICERILELAKVCDEIIKVFSNTDNPAKAQLSI